MTPAEIEACARDAARHALGREPTEPEVIRALVTWCAQLDAAVSDGFLRRPPARPVRPRKAPPPTIT